MSYRNIDSILKENGQVTIVSRTGTQPAGLSEFPRLGEVVGLLTEHNQYLQVEIENAESEQTLYQGKVKHEICETGSVDFEVLLTCEELIEFSHSKVHGIFRK